jgi:phosphoribosylglycinamide formyltransferase-1
MVHIALFASGSGSNAENIFLYFQNKPGIRVSCICTNRADAPVIERARRLSVPILIFSKSDFYESTRVLDYLREYKADWVVLAGFLWLVPDPLISRYPNRIINIHPALLPKYGGKGMYGHHVHEAVLANREKQSGITIHLIDPEYDKGPVLFQATCPVKPHDTPESLAARVHELEYRFFPKVIEETIQREGRKG